MLRPAGKRHVTITNGPIATLYEYRDAKVDGVIIAYTKKSGKIGGIYFKSGSVCEKHARKYQEIWLKDRNE